MTIQRILSKGLFILAALLALLGGSGVTAWMVTASAQGEIADPETVYVVQRGDTLYSIARRYGVTVQALMSYNGLTSTTIYVGQRLLIPGGNPGPGPVEPVIHIVQRGDTLYSLARRYATTVQAIMSYNSLTSTNIYVGQRLRIPTRTPPEQLPLIHVVQRGETLYSIARRYGTTVAAIQAANGLHTTTIYVGQRLTIPVGNPPPPEGAQRIEFAPGASSATVAGRTTPGAPQRYVVRALQGQTMKVVLETANEASYIAVLNPNGENMAGAGGPIHQWEGRLPVTGDYTIEVRATGSTPADFRLTVTIPPASGPSQETGQAIIEGVEVRILESYPVQVQAVVRGKLPDACTSIERIEQVRESTTFRIRITTMRNPNQMCAQVLTPFEQVCSLDVAGLPPGRYEVRVNEVITPFDLP